MSPLPRASVSSMDDAIEDLAEEYLRLVPQPPIADYLVTISRLLDAQIRELKPLQSPDSKRSAKRLERASRKRRK